MKQLSYREKICLLLFIVLIVIVVFIAWPIKTIKGNIKTHTAEETEVQKVFDENHRLIDQIPNIEKNITEVYDASKVFSEKFTIQRKNFEIDKYMQEVLNSNEMNNGPKHAIEVYGEFKEDESQATEIPFYYYTPNVITYPILETADTNGNLLQNTDAELDKKVNAALVMCQLENQQVEVHNASVKMKFTKDAILALADKLKDLDSGVRITSIAIDDIKFGKLADLPEDEGYSSGTVTFSFYTMQQIQQPKFD